MYGLHVLICAKAKNKFSHLNALCWLFCFVKCYSNVIKIVVYNKRNMNINDGQLSFLTFNNFVH